MLTLMRFLAGVSADMDRQGAPLYEAFTTSFCCTGVRSLIRMYPVMPLEVGLPVETLRSYK